jgi:hypothetical protein
VSSSTESNTSSQLSAAKAERRAQREALSRGIAAQSPEAAAALKVAGMKPTLAELVGLALEYGVPPARDVTDASTN